MGAQAYRTPEIGCGSWAAKVSPPYRIEVWGGVVALNRKKFDGIPLTYSSILALTKMLHT